jgi:hypothetical protein
MPRELVFSMKRAVATGGLSMDFKPSGMWLMDVEYTGDRLLTADETAKYLWRRFTERMK